MKKDYELFIDTMDEITEEYLTDGDIEYDSTSQCAYEKFICDLKEELQTWDKIFDNLTHTLVKKVEKWVEDKKSAKEIIDMLKSECLEQNK